MPLVIVPTVITPVKDGTRVTSAPGIGVKVSSGVGELYSCAVMVTVDRASVTVAATLKYAAISVMVPALGMEKA